MYGGGWDRDYTIPFVGSSHETGLYVDGRESGLFHVHIGMAGYGVYAFTGSRHYPLIYHSKNSIKIIYVNSFN